MEKTRLPWRALAAIGMLAFAVHGRAQCTVTDIFGRKLNDHGITLVDWEGYLANPLIKFNVSPPGNASLPGTATLSANGARLYFESPGSVSASGPRKSISLTSAGTGVPVALSIFPDRDGENEEYTLTIVFSGANGRKETNAIPIHVLDQDRPRTNEFSVTVNFDRDRTGFFTNQLRRALVQQAVDDWSYFFAGMNLDPVLRGTETTAIWSNNFSGSYLFTNTNSYQGYLLYAYGTTNSTHRSGGEGSYSGRVQTSGGKSLSIKRSGGFEAEIYGNYNTLGWLFLTNDDQWLATGNLGNERNDFYSITHHETGHALIFNPAHPGFNRAKSAGAFTGAAITAYYGGPVPIDASDHLNGVIDPESRQGAFGYDYYGNIPRKRWLITKLDLLAAQEVGYQLRQTSPFTALSLRTNSPPAAETGTPYESSFTASGGIPAYHWEIVSGILPPGLALDSFSGTLSGVPAAAGDFVFTVRLRDDHENAPGILQEFQLHVGPAARSLEIELAAPSGGPVRIQYRPVTTPPPVLEASTNLSDWLPFEAATTNISGTPTFEIQTAFELPRRFFRAVWP